MTAIVYQEVERKMSEELGKPVQIQAAHRLGGGCIHHATKIETNVGPWFLKWNADCASDMFSEEARGLQELRKAATVLKIPEVLCFKKVDEVPGFLATEFLQTGTTPDYDEKLGRGLAEVHRYSHSSFGFYCANYCGATLQNNAFTDDWLVFFRENRMEHLLKLIEVRRGLSDSETKVYPKLLDRLSVLLPAGSKPALIHGDLWAGNVMASSHGPALIDPAVYFAEREMEFAITTLFGGFSPAFFAAYNEAFPLRPDWKERNRLYQLYHLLNHYLLFGGVYGAQALAVAQSYL